MAEVVFEDVSKSFGKVDAVKDIKLKIKDREFTRFVGSYKRCF